MLEVKILKQKSSYVKDGEERTATNFFIDCGDERIPIEVKFFPSIDGKDYAFVSRKRVLSAFAESLPDKPLSDKDKSLLAPVKTSK